ncbi:TetR family transcriptional regulator (plasmid) [Stutzerimonas stutzeri]|uniref:TetR family transcriptional regulator n=1 Tax=Pseudomonas extremaustralis TaxID=359110 RepID=UPI002FE10F3E|nr:TetR family transcriptional regulator [Stutzerimonas stutzeri]
MNYLQVVQDFRRIPPGSVFSQRQHHNTYPAVAEKIRNLMGKSVRAQRDSKHQALMNEKEKNRALRAENDQLLEELVRIASVNQRLLFEMAELKAVVSGKVVSITPKPGK